MLQTLKQTIFIVLIETLFLLSQPFLLAFSVEAAALEEEVITEDVHLTEYKTYLARANLAQQEGDIDQVVSVIQEAFANLSKDYHLKLHKYLAKLKTPDKESEKKYVTRRRASIITILGESTPKQKIKANFWLAKSRTQRKLFDTDFFAPESALDIYLSLCEAESIRLSKLDPKEILKGIERAFFGIEDSVGWEECKKQKKVFYKRILLKNEPIHPLIYEEALKSFTSSIFSDEEDKALSMEDEALTSKSFLESTHKSIEKSLLRIYIKGKDGIKDHRKAFSLLTKHLETEPIGSDDYISIFSDLSELELVEVFPIFERHLKSASPDAPYYPKILFKFACYCRSHSNPARDIARAILLLNELYNCTKAPERINDRITNLRWLWGIYAHEEGYIDTEKAAQLRKELDDLQASRRETSS